MRFRRLKINNPKYFAFETKHKNNNWFVAIKTPRYGVLSSVVESSPTFKSKKRSKHQTIYYSNNTKNMFVYDKNQATKRQNRGIRVPPNKAINPRTSKVPQNLNIVRDAKGMQLTYSSLR